MGKYTDFSGTHTRVRTQSSSVLFCPLCFYLSLPSTAGINISVTLGLYRLSHRVGTLVVHHSPRIVYYCTYPFFVLLHSSAVFLTSVGMISTFLAIIHIKPLGVGSVFLFGFVGHPGDVCTFIKASKPFIKVIVPFYISYQQAGRVPVPS